MRIRIVFSAGLALLLVQGAFTTARGQVSEVRTLDLARASVTAGTEPLWIGMRSIERRADGGVTLVPPHPIAIGWFPHAAFRGSETLSWKGYEELVLVFRCEGEGPIGLVLAEYDNGISENYAFHMDSVEPGFHRLTIRLAPKPDGDLRLSGPTRDGKWNPDPEDGVNMILSSYPRGFEIEGMTLQTAVKEGEAR